MVLRKALRAAVLALPFCVSVSSPGEAGDSGWYGRDDVFLQFEFGEYRYPEPAWAAGGISCRGGWKIVRTRGFRHVHPIECRGKTFTYLGQWRGDTFRVFVNSATGRILGVGPA